MQNLGDAMQGEHLQIWILVERMVGKICVYLYY